MVTQEIQRAVRLHDYNTGIPIGFLRVEELGGGGGGGISGATAITNSEINSLFD